MNLENAPVAGLWWQLRELAADSGFEQRHGKAAIKCRGTEEHASNALPTCLNDIAKV
jgi:hypothetical protein